MFLCEFCEISRSNFFTEHLRTTASNLKQSALRELRPKVIKIGKWQVITESKGLIIWDKVFKNGPNKICGKRPLKNLKGNDLV